MEYVKNHFQDVCDDVVECTILDQKNQVLIFCGGVFFAMLRVAPYPFVALGYFKDAEWARDFNLHEMFG